MGEVSAVAYYILVEVGNYHVFFSSYELTEAS